MIVRLCSATGDSDSDPDISSLSATNRSSALDKLDASDQRGVSGCLTDNRLHCTESRRFSALRNCVRAISPAGSSKVAKGSILAVFIPVQIAAWDQLHWDVFGHQGVYSCQVDDWNLIDA